jgi:CxxC motif-containing protein (DUF1111 family)
MVAARQRWRAQSRVAHAAAVGFGMRQAVNAHSRLLHDGRSRSLEEAILWQGDGAQAGRDRLRIAAQTPRQDLIAFLSR